ncbi:arsenate reductase ArsC [Desulfovibrio cuneatus]|uniref:arsenate reductase ArsC n=1 Tax=Desulfovibrio cuneatus TaxID=159728 RepID=UPI00042821E7|nr:arsenate reductase ArsC [Desulfovibrio cuneatus]
MRILFLCTGNSCRSILAEAIFNSLAPAGFVAQSAGSKPAGYVHPGALAELARHGIANTGFTSKSWDAIAHTPDIVITLCASAAGETCPVYLGNVLRVHWGVADPAGVSDPAAQEQAFAHAYAVLRARITDFFRLIAEQGAALATNRPELEKELAAIGQRHNDQ